MGLIKSLVATYNAKAGGDWNTGEIRQKPTNASKPDAAAKQPEAKRPEGWNANSNAPANGDWNRK